MVKTQRKHSPPEERDGPHFKSQVSVTRASVVRFLGGTRTSCCGATEILFFGNYAACFNWFHGIGWDSNCFFCDPRIGFNRIHHIDVVIVFLEAFDCTLPKLFKSAQHLESYDRKQIDR